MKTRKEWKDVKDGDRVDVGQACEVWGIKKNHCSFFSDDGFYSTMYPNDIVSVEHDPVYEVNVFDDCYKVIENPNCNPEHKRARIPFEQREAIENYWSKYRSDSKAIVKDICEKFNVGNAAVSRIVRFYKKRKGIA